MKGLRMNIGISLCVFEILQDLSCCTNRLLKVHMMYDVTATVLQSLGMLGHHFFGLGLRSRLPEGFGRELQSMVSGYNLKQSVT